MVVSDPIADMLTRIRNSIMTRHESTDVPYSNVKFAVAKILKDEGYVKNYKVYIDEKRRKFIKVYISYDEYSQSVITGLERVSKPGRLDVPRLDSTRLSWCPTSMSAALDPTSADLPTAVITAFLDDLAAREISAATIARLRQTLLETPDPSTQVIQKAVLGEEIGA